MKIAKMEFPVKTHKLQEPAVILRTRAWYNRGGLFPMIHLKELNSAIPPLSLTPPCRWRVCPVNNKGGGTAFWTIQMVTRAGFLFQSCVMCSSPSFNHYLPHVIILQPSRHFFWQFFFDKVGFLEIKIGFHEGPRGLVDSGFVLEKYALWESPDHTIA